MTTISNEAVHNKLWSFDTKTFLTQFSSACNKLQFPDLLEKVQQFVIQLFQKDPSGYSELLFEICTIEQIEMMAGFLEFVLSEMNFESSLKVTKSFINPSNVDKGKKLKICVSKLIPKLLRKTKAIPKEVVELVDNEFWEKNPNVLSECLEIVLDKFDEHFHSNQLLPFCRHLVSTSSSNFLKMYVSNFMYCVEKRVSEKHDEIAKRTNNNNSLIRKLPNNAKCSLDGCNGCNLLENFLANPSKKESNISVNINYRKWHQEVRKLTSYYYFFASALLLYILQGLV